MNLSAMSSARTLNVEWLNPATGATTTGTPIPAGSSSRSFTPPFSGDAVLYLVDSAGHAGAAVVAADLVQRHGTGGRHLSLSSPCNRRGRQPRPVLEHRRRDDSSLGYAAADGSGRSDGDDASKRADCPELDGSNGQRRGDGVPGGAVPGCGLLIVRAGSRACGDRHDVHRFGTAGVDELFVPGARD